LFLFGQDVVDVSFSEKTQRYRVGLGESILNHRS